MVSVLAWGITFRLFLDKSETLDAAVKLYNEIVEREPKTIIEYVDIPVTEYIEIPIEIIREIEVPITVPVEVEKIVEIPRELREFENVNALHDWLEQDTSTDVLVIVSGEPFNGQCENLAFQLRDSAISSGYLIETEIMSYQDFVTHFGNTGGMSPVDSHCLCKTIIGNNVWFVEPSTDEVWLAYRLD
jgi:hypothetical protein